MNILKTGGMFSETGRFESVDTIPYKGYLWLVLDWIKDPDKKYQRPKRIIRLDGQKYQTLSSHPEWSFQLTLQMKKVLFDDPTLTIEANPYVIDNPDIWVEIPNE